MNPISLPTHFAVKEEGEKTAVFTIEPFYPGYGTTVGNALRRVLLSSLEGVAISAVKIKGIAHEFSTLPGVKEDFVDIMLNLKKIILKVEDFVVEEGMKLFLSVHGEKEVTAGDFETTTGVAVVNKDFVICTLTGSAASLEMEAHLSRGRGFFPVESREQENRELGLIAIDSYYSPIEKVGFAVEDVRVGQMTNYDRVRLTVQTNGVISPREAVRLSLEILITQFQHISELSQSSITQGTLAQNAQEEPLLEAEVASGESMVGEALSEPPESTNAQLEEKPKAKRGRKKKEE